MDEMKPLHRADAGDPLARLLAHGRGFAVDYDVDAGLARHEQLVAQGVPPPTTAPLESAGSGKGWLGLGRGWLGVGGAIASAAIVFAITSAPTRPVESTITARAPAFAAAVPPPAAMTEPADAIAAQTARPIAAAQPPSSREPAAALPAATRARPRSSRRSPDPPPAPPAAVPRESTANPAATDALQREAAQIRQIRTQLDTSPERALAACDAGDREFRDGVFAIERTGLRALALFALGRDDQAAIAAARYLDAQPRGALAARLHAARGD